MHDRQPVARSTEFLRAYHTFWNSMTIILPILDELVIGRGLLDYNYFEQCTFGTRLLDYNYFLISKLY